MYGTGSGSCPTVGFITCNVEPLGSTTTKLVNPCTEDCFFWNVMPRYLVDRYPCFRGTCCVMLIVTAVRTSDLT